MKLPFSSHWCLGDCQYVKETAVIIHFRVLGVVTKYSGFLVRIIDEIINENVTSLEIQISFIKNKLNVFHFLSLLLKINFRMKMGVPLNEAMNRAWSFLCSENIDTKSILVLCFYAINGTDRHFFLVCNLWMFYFIVCEK